MYQPTLKYDCELKVTLSRDSLWRNHEKYTIPILIAKMESTRNVLVYPIYNHCKAVRSSMPRNRYFIGSLRISR